MKSIATRSGACVALALLVIFLGCGGGSTTSSQQATDPSPQQPQQQQPGDTQYLSQSEVQAVVNATAASVNDPLVIAVADRAGRPLAVFRKTGAPTTAVGNFS